MTLTGIGGVGKTRLAPRATAGLQRAFRDGVWLIQLDQVRDQALVAQAVAGVLGLQDPTGYAPAAARDACPGRSARAPGYAAPAACRARVRIPLAAATGGSGITQLA